MKRILEKSELENRDRIVSIFVLFYYIIIYLVYSISIQKLIDVVTLEAPNSDASWLRFSGRRYDEVIECPVLPGDTSHGAVWIWAHKRKLTEAQFLRLRGYVRKFTC